MQITLAQFEKIDGLFGDLTRMGDFMLCDDPRLYITTQNRLYGACVDALGKDEADKFESAEACAARLITHSLTGKIEVVDAEAE